MFAEQYHVALVASALNLATGASQDTDSINMANYHRCTFLIDVGTMGVANATLTVYSGATNGAADSALTFNYAYGSASALWATQAANHDVLAAWTSAASLIIVQATQLNHMLVVDVPAAAMDLANDEKWLTMRFTDAGGATGLVSVFAVLEPRYAAGQSVSAMV